MTFAISPKQMKIYRDTARRRQKQKAQELNSRHQRAWKVAQQAGQILKKQFGAQRVVVFGSILFRERFHLRSDIDVAVWGLDDKLYYRAVSRLLDLDPTISVDLIEVEFALPELQAIIEQEGAPL